MKRAASWLFLLAVARCAGAVEGFQLPAFPAPTLVADGGLPLEVSPIRLLRELHRAGLRGFDRLDTLDTDYALLRSDSLGALTAWLDATCGALNYDLSRARTRSYDGTVFARLLDVATSLGTLQSRHRALAIPIGVVSCQRTVAWGALPGDGATDVYVIFATESGMTVYDPPTRQMVSLADFPNKAKISQIRF
jgi:hypothetical protein